MNEETEVTQSKTFPWGALAVYVVVVLGIAAYNFFTIDTSLMVEDIDTGSMLAGGVIGLIIGAIGSIILIAIQYVFIKFPTQWIAKENFVYKYDIWSALFYSGAIGAVITFMVQQLGYVGNLYFDLASSAITTALFLFFYFSGEEKESNIKRAITIVRVGWFVIGAILSIALQSVVADFLV
ncbi:hypothetical protein [Marinilactibacillus kalidii]|uniref:hypothetical protein n=1 Tax=Marinilactibacillus kalidii TaxID=2820274 RepID=UPI001ABDC5B9|nr:hypothetical protein [Marinilactibacillus kalidii]